MSHFINIKFKIQNMKYFMILALVPILCGSWVNSGLVPSSGLVPGSKRPISRVRICSTVSVLLPPYVDLSTSTSFLRRLYFDSLISTSVLRHFVKSWIIIGRSKVLVEVKLGKNSRRKVKVEVKKSSKYRKGRTDAYPISTIASRSDLRSLDYFNVEFD